MSNEELILVQYEKPPAWLEWGIYIGSVCLLAASVATNLPWFAMGLAAILMYWNYRLFRIITEFVRYRNASEFSKLLTKLAALEDNEHKDGTIPVQECLTKEQESEEDSSQ